MVKLRYLGGNVLGCQKMMWPLWLVFAVLGDEVFNCYCS